ncbi:MAG: hypothetical protein O7A98_08020 [Acidobacteria bacterium]|nr:hypothetical protein [Acidobacteriota bacterium]
MTELIQQNLDVIDRGAALLERLRHAGERACIGEVGPHFRHCIDFYDCFLAGLEPRRIDYDARDRSAAVESAPEPALAALHRIRGRLDELGEEEGELRVRADVVTEQATWTRSTVNRELLFLLSHTIHHYALIALLLRQGGIDVPTDFGFAPSTLEHQKRQTECAP